MTLRNGPAWWESRSYRLSTGMSLGLIPGGQPAQVLKHVISPPIADTPEQVEANAERQKNSQFEGGLLETLSGFLRKEKDSGRYSDQQILGYLLEEGFYSVDLEDIPSARRAASALLKQSR